MRFRVSVLNGLKWAQKSVAWQHCFAGGALGGAAAAAAGKKQSLYWALEGKTQTEDKSFKLFLVL